MRPGPESRWKELYRKRGVWRSPLPACGTEFPCVLTPSPANSCLFIRTVHFRRPSSVAPGAVEPPECESSKSAIARLLLRAAQRHRGGDSPCCCCRASAPPSAGNRSAAPLLHWIRCSYALTEAAVQRFGRRRSPGAVSASARLGGPCASAKLQQRALRPCSVLRHGVRRGSAQGIQPPLWARMARREAAAGVVSQPLGRRSARPAWRRAPARHGSAMAARQRHGASVSSAGTALWRRWQRWNGPGSALRGAARRRRRRGRQAPLLSEISLRLFAAEKLAKCCARNREPQIALVREKNAKNNFFLGFRSAVSPCHIACTTRNSFALAVRRPRTWAMGL